MNYLQLAIIEGDDCLISCMAYISYFSQPANGFRKTSERVFRETA